MIRHSLLTVGAGAALVLVAFIGDILVVGPAPLLRSLLIGLAVLGTAALGAGVLQLTRFILGRAAQGREREAALRSRLEELERRPVPTAAAPGAPPRAPDPGPSAPIGPDAATADRLRWLETSAGEAAASRRSQSTWAHEIETRLTRSLEDLEAVTERTAAGRRADHERLADLERAVVDLAVRTGTDLTAVLSPEQARRLAGSFARRSDYLRVKPILESFDILDELEPKRLVAALKAYRRHGYLAAQAAVSARLLEIGGGGLNPENLRSVAAELDFFLCPEDLPVPDLGDLAGVHDPAGPIVHVVGKVLPETQTGYTLRTQYTLRALRSRGIDALVMCQSGAPGGNAEQTSEHEVDGVRYVMLGGGARHESTYQQWLAHNIVRAAEVLRRERPSLLHAHSDFLNALIATELGRAFDIPVVYESRGFWEESWISRLVAAQDLEAEGAELFAAYGLPEAYSLRRDAEIRARELCDANLTLGRTMREHILALSPSKLPEGVALVPNGIDVDAFPAPERDPKLGAELGIDPEDIVIGCISSIVEYEGIDILLRAVRLMQTRRRDGGRIRLLIVGDGARLESLRELADEIGLAGAVFTGRVPHEDVLDYYGQIDIFVVPRRPTAVSRLVTPLKPYEALATGRALVVSDVPALQEIAEDSDGAVCVFRAGDAVDLARVLDDLITDPERRRDLAARGSAWVTRERTWDTNAEVLEEVYRGLGVRISPGDAPRGARTPSTEMP